MTGRFGLKWYQVIIIQKQQQQQQNRQQHVDSMDMGNSFQAKCTSSSNISSVFVFDDFFTPEDVKMISLFKQGGSNQPSVDFLRTLRKMLKWH